MSRFLGSRRALFGSGSRSVFAGTAVAGAVRIPKGSKYSGPIIRVRESAGNTEQDIFAGAPDANGNRYINTTALLTFTGANSGFITTYYDQSGNGRNITQPTAAFQARIVNAGVVDTLNGVPAPRYLGNGATGNGYTVALTLAQPVTIIIVYRLVSYIASGHLTDGTGVSNRLLVGYTSATQRILYAGGVSSTTPAEAVGSSFTWASVFNGGASFTSINGTASATLSPGAQSTLGQVIGGGQGAAGGFAPQFAINGYIQEYLIYPSALTTAQILAIQQNQGIAYNISAFAGAAAAYSLRIPFGSDYNGPLIRVRRSNDNAELDIGAVSTYDANGNRFINTTALLAFTGANSGFVTTRYDLTGNGRHETQTTSAAQPRIVNAGVVDTAGGIPTIVFSGAQGLVTPITLSRTTYPNVLVNTVYQATNISSGTQTLWGGDNASSGFPRWQVLYFGIFPSASFSVSTGSASLVQANMNNTNRNVYSYVSNYPTASASYVAINGTQNTSFTETVGSGALALTFGAINPSLLYPFTGNIQESIVWFSAPTVAQRQAIERNQGTAYGITVA